MTPVVRVFHMLWLYLLRSEPCFGLQLVKQLFCQGNAPCARCGVIQVYIVCKSLGSRVYGNICWSLVWARLGTAIALVSERAGYAYVGPLPCCRLCRGGRQQLLLQALKL